MFRPSLVAEIRAGYTRNRFTTTPATLGLDFSTLGIGSADPALKTHSALAMFPRIEVGGGIEPLGMNRAGLIDDLEGTRELQAHVTWVKSSHTIKGGMQLARLGSMSSAPISVGQYPAVRIHHGQIRRPHRHGGFASPLSCRGTDRGQITATAIPPPHDVLPRTSRTWRVPKL